MKTDLFQDLRTDHRQRDSQRRRDHLTFRGNVRQGRHGWLRLTPAYGLTPDEIALMSATAPPRMPIAAPRRSGKA